MFTAPPQHIFYHFLSPWPTKSIAYSSLKISDDFFSLIIYPWKQLCRPFEQCFDPFPQFCALFAPILNQQIIILHSLWVLLAQFAQFYSANSLVWLRLRAAPGVAPPSLPRYATENNPGSADVSLLVFCELIWFLSPGFRFSLLDAPMSERSRKCPIYISRLIETYMFMYEKSVSHACYIQMEVHSKPFDSDSCNSAVKADWWFCLTLVLLSFLIRISEPSSESTVTSSKEVSHEPGIHGLKNNNKLNLVSFCLLSAYYLIESVADLAYISAFT